MSKLKTLVVGGSVNTSRFSNKAIRKLLSYGYSVESIGLREGEVEGVKIQTGKPDLKGIHTITMYIGPKNQPEMYDYLLGLKPERIILNPGTENDGFASLASKRGIDIVYHCTLVMLNEGIY